MVKAYLKYSLASTFGVVASSGSLIARACALAPLLENEGNTLFDGGSRKRNAGSHGTNAGSSSASISSVLCCTPAVDAVLIWNVKSGTLLHRLANETTSQAGNVTSLQCSPDQKWVAAGYQDGSIRLWRLDKLGQDEHDRKYLSHDPSSLSTPTGDSGDAFLTFNAHRSCIQCLAWNSQGTTLASGSADGDVILWDVVGECGLFRFGSAHTDAVTSLSFIEESAGNHMHKKSIYVVSSSKDGLLRVYDLTSRHCIQTIVGHRGEIWSHQVNKAGTILVTGSVDSELRVYKIHPRRSVNRSPEQDPSSQNDHERSEAGEQTQILEYIGSVRRSVSSRVVSMSFLAPHIAADENSETSDNAKTLTPENGLLAVCGADKTVEIFLLRSEADAESHRKRRKQRLKERMKRKAASRQTNQFIDVDAHPDNSANKEVEYVSEDVNSIVASDTLRSLRLVSMSHRLHGISAVKAMFRYVYRKRKQSLVIPQLTVACHFQSNALDFYSIPLQPKSSDGNGLEFDSDDDENEDSKKKTIEFADMELLASLDLGGHRGDVRSIDLSPDDSVLLSVSSSKTLKVWSLTSRSLGQCLRTIPISGYGLNCLFVPERRNYAVVSTREGSLEVYHIGSGAAVGVVNNAHNGAVWSIAWSSKSNADTGEFSLISGGADKCVKFWRFDEYGEATSKGSTGCLTLERTLELTDDVLCVRTSPDGRLLFASLLDGTVRSFYLDTLKPFASFYGHKLPVLSMDISDDNQMLVTASADKTIKLWGTDFGDLRRSLRGHEESVMTVRFQPNTHYFVSGSRDGTLRYWDADQFEMVSTLPRHQGECWSLCLSKDGEILASASSDRAIRIWRRTDEPMFLEDERETRMDDMFEKSLLDDYDNAQRGAAGATATPHELLPKSVVFTEQEHTNPESTIAVKRTLETVRGGEQLMEALQLADLELGKKQEMAAALAALLATSSTANTDHLQYKPSLLLLGLLPHEYVLRSLKRIRNSDLESALLLLTFDQSVSLLSYCVLFLQSESISLPYVELVTRTVLLCIRNFQAQFISASHDHRLLIFKLSQLLRSRMQHVRKLYGSNQAAIQIWMQEILDQQDWESKPSFFRSALAGIQVENMERNRMISSGGNLGNLNTKTKQKKKRAKKE